MRSFTAETIRAALTWPALLEAIEAALVAGRVVSPDRHVAEVPDGAGAPGALLLMPAWDPGQYIGVKAVTYFESNAGTNVPTINAGYLLFDGRTGQLAGIFDGDELTARRTAAASALAGRKLVRSGARRLLVVGTGQLSAETADAHASQQTFDSIEIWGRRPDAAARIVAELERRGRQATVSDDLDASVASADVISTVTGAKSPIIDGSLLRPGAHLDLIGSFSADMREATDEAVARATVFVDTRAGASLAGDIAQPLADGVLTEADLVADLAELATGRHPGRTSDDEVTVFKSAGFALLDLTAARLALGAAD